MRRHLRASRRMSARPCDLHVQTGARESELRSTSGMISSIKRGQLIIRHRPGLIILFIKPNNQNEIFLKTGKLMELKIKAPEEYFAQAQLSTIDI